MSSTAEENRVKCFADFDRIQREVIKMTEAAATAPTLEKKVELLTLVIAKQGVINAAMMGYAANGFLTFNEQIMQVLGKRVTL